MAFLEEVHSSAVRTVLQSGTKVRKDLNGGWAEGAA